MTKPIDSSGTRNVPMQTRAAQRPDKQDQRTLALWAADCAEHVLPLFEEPSARDKRPRQAIEAARAWARGEIRCGAACAAALAAHAAARACTDEAARAAARAAGHAAATAHVSTHARGTAVYAVKAAVAEASASAIAAEGAWQRQRLPKRLRGFAFPVQDKR